LPKKRDFRIGILGSGFVVNECHLPAYRKAGFNPVAIASRNRQKAEQTAQRHGIPKVYDSYEDLLDDPSIEVLDIAVPPQAQLNLIERACARKTVRGILAQKPLGINYKEAVDGGRCSASRRASSFLSIKTCATTSRCARPKRCCKTASSASRFSPPLKCAAFLIGCRGRRNWAGPLCASCPSTTWIASGIGSAARKAFIAASAPIRARNFRTTDGICTYILEYANGLRCVGIDDPWTGPAKEGCPSDIYLRWRIEGLNGLAIGDIGWCRDPYTTPSTIKFASKGDQGFHEPKWTESWFPDAFIGNDGATAHRPGNGDGTGHQHGGQFEDDGAG
jgi:predicted dehydrogenase